MFMICNEGKHPFYKKNDTFEIFKNKLQSCLIQYPNSMSKYNN